ncbi:MAG: 3-deoxy-manno-octulosonate cytidylyltransferase [Parachlamydiales bacterium]
MTHPLIVIPARMGSTRFPNKPLAKIKGVAMVERVWRIGRAAGAQVVVATDDAELAHFAKGFGAEVVMTHPTHKTGSDRAAEVADHFPDAAVILVLQGDAPLTPPWVVKALLDEMERHPNVEVATPAVRLTGEAKVAFIQSKREGSSTGTTVVFDLNRDALYFSKALLPFSRKGEPEIFRHIGLYAYRREALLRLTRLPQSPLEKTEGLEQLRALENGIPIRIVEVDYRGRTHGSVDRPEDIATVEEIIEREGELV